MILRYKLLLIINFGAMSNNNKHDLKCNNERVFKYKNYYYQHYK